MKELLYAMVEELVEDKSAIEIKVDEPGEDGTVVYHLHVAPNDMGRAASVTTRTLAQVQAMCPDLVCDKDGDERLIVEAIYRNRNFNKSKLGFFLLEPKNNTKGTDGNNALFLYKLVIVPKPGLFPVTE